MSEPTPEQNAQLEVTLQYIAKIEEALLREDPEMPNYIKWINNEVRQYPELMHLLTDEQIAPIYQGIMKVTGVQIAVTKSRAGKSTAKSKNTGLLDDGTSVGSLL